MRPEREEGQGCTHEQYDVRSGPRSSARAPPRWVALVVTCRTSPDWSERPAGSTRQRRRSRRRRRGSTRGSSATTSCASPPPSRTSRTEWAAEQLRLPPAMIERIFWQLKEDQFVEILGQVDELNYRYAVDRPRPRAGEAAARSLRLRRPGAGVARGVHGDARLADRGSAGRRDVRQRPPHDQRLAGAAGRRRSRSRRWRRRPGAACSSSAPPATARPASAALAQHDAAARSGSRYCIGIDSTIIRIYDRQIHQPSSCNDASGTASAFERVDADRPPLGAHPPAVRRRRRRDDDGRARPGLQPAPPHLRGPAAPQGQRRHVPDRRLRPPAHRAQRAAQPLDHPAGAPRRLPDAARPARRSRSRSG